MHTKLLITRREAGLMLTGLAAAIAVPVRGAEQSAKPHKFTARPQKVSLRGKDLPPTEIWNLDDGGEFFKAKVGEECIIEVQNGIDLPLSLHWHGARTMPNAMDGVGGLTQEPIAPGGSFTYRFTPKEPGVWLIRPCVIGGTSEPAGRGLSRLFVIEDPDEKIGWPGISGFGVSVPFVINDWLLDDTGKLQNFRKTSRGRLGNFITANQEPTPKLFDTVHFGGEAVRVGTPTERVAQPMRYRMLLTNACNARSFRLRFDHMKAYVVAIDGQPTEAFEPLKASLPFSPGNRYDIVLDIPRGPDGVIVAELGKDIPLAVFKASPNLPVEYRPLTPQPNPALPQTIRLQDALRFDIDLNAAFGKPAPDTKIDERAPTVWDFNGLSPEVRKEKPLFSVKSGRPVVLKLSNNTAVPQPIHVHGHCFRLLHPFDDGWDPFWVDTLLVPAKTTVRVAFITGSPGKWLIASTICEHFDTGLWGWFEVA